MLTEAKNKYHAETLTNFMKTSPQRFWRYLSGSDSKSYSVVVNDALVTDPTVISSCFNSYFQSVFTVSDEVGSLPLPRYQSHCTPMSDITLTYEGILSLILDIDEKKSVGPDEIPNIFLRRYAELVAHYLNIIFTASIAQKQLPDD